MKPKMRRGLTVMDLLLFVAAVVVIVVCVVKFMPGLDIPLHLGTGGKRAQTEDDAEDGTGGKRAQTEDDAEDLERLSRKARLRREQEEDTREAERQARKRKLAEEEAERKRQIAEQEAARREYRAAQERFAAPFAFARFAPDDEKPQRVSDAKTFWAVFASYASDKAIHEVRAEPGGVLHVVALSSDGRTQEVNAAAFVARLQNEPYALTSGGKVWVGGIRMPVGAYPVPARGDGFSLMEDNFGGFLPVAVALGLKPPDANYRIYLRPPEARTAKDNIPIGSVAYDGVLERGVLEEIMGKRLVQRAMGGLSTGKVKLKKAYKPTVVLYDGTHIKKELGGVTKVPRTYRFHGTNYGNGRAESEFRSKWEKLHSEAIRQERKARQIQEENAALLARAKADQERKKAEASLKGSDDQAIDDALAKCKLVVEYIRPGGK